MAFDLKKSQKRNILAVIHSFTTNTAKMFTKSKNSKMYKNGQKDIQRLKG